MGKAGKREQGQGQGRRKIGGREDEGSGGYRTDTEGGQNSARIEAGVRLRLSQILSAAGVRRSDIAQEVLFLLPTEFLRAYEELFHRALDANEDGKGLRDVAKADLERAAGLARNGGWRVRSSEETPMVPSSGGGSRKHTGVFPVRDDKALGEKERIDRALRKLTRSMKAGLEAGASAVKCEDQVAVVGGKRVQYRGCGKWLEAGWRFCPFCGNDMRKDLRASMK